MKKSKKEKEDIEPNLWENVTEFLSSRLNVELSVINIEMDTMSHLHRTDDTKEERGHSRQILMDKLGERGRFN